MTTQPTQKKDCMFQYATSHSFEPTTIYEDTDLITYDEARTLWYKHLPQFIRELQNEYYSPEMAIWGDCDSNTNYHKELFYANNDTKTDGLTIWNEQIIKQELEP